MKNVRNTMGLINFWRLQIFNLTFWITWSNIKIRLRKNSVRRY
jgi:hypothetical protein